jgi:hypothetical protein
MPSWLEKDEKYAYKKRQETLAKIKQVSQVQGSQIMEAMQRALGGALIALARKYMPDYSFAAFVHHGEEVDVYFFKGRLLERKTSLSAGSETLEIFKSLQSKTKRRNGLFSRISYKTARITIQAREQAESIRYGDWRHISRQSQKSVWGCFGIGFITS